MHIGVDEGVFIEREFAEHIVGRVRELDRDRIFKVFSPFFPIMSFFPYFLTGQKTATSSAF